MVSHEIGKGELSEESITYTSNRSLTAPPDLRLIHYNDIYHVEAGSREPVGGFARFKTICQFYQHHNNFKDQVKALTFFSGDAFNPSLESSVTKGKHMVGTLNAVETDVACLGNHDLDFGVEHFEHLASQCKFPWLCANVLDPALGENVSLGHCNKTSMLTSSNGIFVGVIGVVEREWLDTINIIPPNLCYLESRAVVAELAPKLRADGAEIIVVVAHQRETNDIKLASKLAPGTVDIILGGHDHYYAHTLVNGIHVLRSGSDFKQLSYLECRRKPDGSLGWDVDIVRQDVVASVPEDADAVARVDQITASLKSKLEKPIGFTLAPLDARFTTVRLRESNIGNFVCDLMRLHYGADCCIMAAGTIRGDQIYPPGVLRVRDILNCFPFEDPCVLIGVKGKNILEALENGVSKYPRLEGRFPQVSNITFAFDASQEPGSRCRDVFIAGSPVDLNREYKLLTRDYMVRGKDGFGSLMLAEKGGTARSIVSDENGVLISMILRQYFMSLKVLGKWKTWGTHHSQHWNKIHDSLHQIHPVQEPAKADHDTLIRAYGSETDLEKSHRDIVPINLDSETTQLLHRANTGQTKSCQRSFRETKQSMSYGDDKHTLPFVPMLAAEEDRKLLIMRKVTRKWWRLAKLQGHPHACNAESDEFGVHWTKGICPRIEGRITVVGIPS